MKTAAIERSVLSFEECHNGGWVNGVELDGAERIIVGTGPGSFAGIRSAIAFAQGYALGKAGVEVLGIPSAAALARECEKRAVAGDARQGMVWLALFDGFELLRPVFQVKAEELGQHVPEDFNVVSPDDARIGGRLKELFGARYLGLAVPDAAGLLAAAEANPKLLQKDPLPIYLNPAVRPPQGR